jgi:hypothetical protein
VVLRIFVIITRKQYANVINGSQHENHNASNRAEYEHPFENTNPEDQYD